MKYPPSIIQPYLDECYLCDRGGKLEIHHVMYASDREKATEDGLVIALCPECHYRVHHDAELRLNLKWMAQRKYEETHTHEEWMRRYRKNYG